MSARTCIVCKHPCGERVPWSLVGKWQYPCHDECGARAERELARYAARRAAAVRGEQP